MMCNTFYSGFTQLLVLLLVLLLAFMFQVTWLLLTVLLLTYSDFFVTFCKRHFLLMVYIVVHLWYL